jgi:hypothetical protein
METVSLGGDWSVGIFSQSLLMIFVMPSISPDREGRGQRHDEVIILSIPPLLWPSLTP